MKYKDKAVTAAKVTIERRNEVVVDVNGPQSQYDAEERCMKIARTKAKYEYTKNVMQEIIGDCIVEPTRSNIPLDFIVKDKDTDKPIGGIEHFHVSLIYEDNGKSQKSTSKKHEEQTKELFNKYQGTDDQEMLKVAFNEAATLAADSINDIREFDYKKYIKHFRHQTEKHFGKIEKYCTTAQCKPDKIAFLIEVVIPNCCPWNTVDCKTQKFKELPHKDFPIVQDIIDILKSGKAFGIRYILLVIREEFGNEFGLVYAFDIDDLEKSCKEQNITVYECFAPRPHLAIIHIIP